MTKKIPVIFFILCLLSFLIYKITLKKEKTVLLLGEIEILNIVDSNSINNVKTFFYDKITYKELINEVKRNDKKIVKEKNVYLNQLISSSDMIIIFANNFEYKNKCKKSDKLLSNYNIILEKDINDLIYYIRKMTNSKIIVVGNYCTNKMVEQNISIDSDYIFYDDSKKLLEKEIKGAYIN